VTDKYVAKRKIWMEKRVELGKEMEALKKEGKEETKEGKKKEEEIQAHQRSQPPPPGRTYRALTKIGIWPNIRRFVPGSLDDETNKQKLERRDGMRIHELTKSAVVCYYGVERPAKPSKARMPLEQFVREKEKKFGKKNEHGVTPTSAIYVGAFLLPIAVSAYAGCHWLPNSRIWGGAAAWGDVADGVVGIVANAWNKVV
jgi:hypothetical protein